MRFAAKSEDFVECYILYHLGMACQKAKHTLSTSHLPKIELESIYLKGLISVHTRARLEELNAGLFRFTLEPVEKALCDANLTRA